MQKVFNSVSCECIISTTLALLNHTQLDNRPRYSGRVVEKLLPTAEIVKKLFKSSKFISWLKEEYKLKQLRVFQEQLSIENSAMFTELVLDTNALRDEDADSRGNVR